MSVIANADEKHDLSDNEQEQYQDFGNIVEEINRKADEEDK